MLHTVRARVVVFDLDGTLLRQGSATELLARSFGHPPALEGVMERYRRGMCDNAAVAAVAAPMFAGRSLDDVAAVLAKGEWIDGIDTVVRELRTRGAVVAVATVGFDFVAEFVGRRHDFHAWCGTEMLRDGDRLTGHLLRALEARDKVSFVHRLCRGLAVEFDQVVAVGDSRSDLPLFQVAGASIALNADPGARAVAARAINTDDLRRLLPGLRALT